MAAYAVASIALMATHKVGLTLGHAVLIGIVVLAAVVRARPFLWDWLPFVFLFTMFEDLNSVAGAVSGIVEPRSAVSFEKMLLGGTVATTWLQTQLSGLPGSTAVNVALVVQYLLVDPLPLAAGIWLWCRHRPQFHLFVAGYVLTMSVGFLIYLLFPETPPWFAANLGLIPHVDRFVVEVLQHVGAGALYARADPEPNAAMPSLHVAVPVLLTCFVVGLRSWRSRVSWLMVLAAATTCFGVVYLGEHYLADAVAGLFLGLAAYGFAVGAEPFGSRLLVPLMMRLPTSRLRGGAHLRGAARRLRLPKPVQALVEVPGVGPLRDHPVHGLLVDGSRSEGPGVPLDRLENLPLDEFGDAVEPGTRSVGPG
ncbi:MAG TPA: phosphatase PAP2 family protein [Candidatus Sulfotelmatobacter sp.]|nr:phosphatase PAP2 family protein [Candidatus Sulfotelmatobacter sp.]